MINKKSLMAFGALSVIAGASFVGTNLVSATSSTKDSLASRISSTFNLDETKVQAVIRDFNDTRPADRQQAGEDRLQRLVDNGTITAAQKTTLQNFREDNKATIDELRAQDATRDEVKQALNDSKDKVESWAEKEGIDLDALRVDVGHGRHGHHFQSGHMFGESDTRSE